MEAFWEFIFAGLKKFAGEIIGAVLFAFFLWAFPGFSSLFKYKNQNANNEKKSSEGLRKIAFTVAILFIIFAGYKINENSKQATEENRLHADVKTGKEEIQKELEILQQEEQQLAKLKEELKRHDEALTQAKIKTAEEIRQKADIQRQLEAQRREEEKVKAEIHRQQELLRQEEARKAEETRHKAEIERQREEKRKEAEQTRAELQRKKEELRQAEIKKAEEIRQREEAQRQLEAQRQKNLKAKVIQLSKEERRAFSKMTVYQLYDLAFQNYIPPNDTRTGIKANNDKAIRYFLAAAERGLKEAQFWLGHMYSVGEGVQQNNAEAVKWWEKSASQGLALAQFWLAHKYAKGEGCQKNEQRAIELWRQSSREHPEAFEEIRKLENERKKRVNSDINYSFWQRSNL